MGLPPTFRVDGMLVRLGKYLRCVGYDAVWDVHLETRRAARLADEEGRVFLTCNTRLGEDVAPPARHLFLTSDDPVEQLQAVARALALDLARRLFTRCIRCNVELRTATDDEIATRVPEAVRPRHREFFTCPSCATVFWRGSHVANTCRKLGIEPPGGRSGSTSAPGE